MAHTCIMRFLAFISFTFLKFNPLTRSMPRYLNDCVSPISAPARSSCLGRRQMGRRRAAAEGDGQDDFRCSSKMTRSCKASWAVESEGQAGLAPAEVLLC